MRPSPFDTHVYIQRSNFSGKPGQLFAVGYGPCLGTAFLTHIACSPAVMQEKFHATAEYLREAARIIRMYGCGDNKRFPDVIKMIADDNRNLGVR